MKRILTVLLCLVLVAVCVLSLTACKKEVTFAEFSEQAAEAKKDFFKGSATVTLSGSLKQTFNDTEKKGSFVIKYYPSGDDGSWDYDAADVDSGIADIWKVYVPRFAWNETEQEGYVYKAGSNGFEILKDGETIRKYDKQGRLTYYSTGKTTCKISY